MNNLNSLNLIQLLGLAKEVNYFDSINEENDWTDHEVIYKAINISINSPIQIRAALIMCNMFPPLKIIFKTIIRRYIKHYMQ